MKDTDVLKSYRNSLMQDVLRDEEVRSCNCIGPQNGQPKCPCMMKNVRVVNGEYVEIIKLGRVK